MTIKNIHKIEQPREKMEKYGASKLNDAELLAILLRTGPKGGNVLDHVIVTAKGYSSLKEKNYLKNVDN